MRLNDEQVLKHLNDNGFLLLNEDLRCIPIGRAHTHAYWQITHVAGNEFLSNDMG